jgi:hypothetical protein
VCESPVESMECSRIKDSIFRGVTQQQKNQPKETARTIGLLLSLKFQFVLSI